MGGDQRHIRYLLRPGRREEIFKYLNCFRSRALVAEDMVRELKHYYPLIPRGTLQRYYAEWRENQQWR